jgi:hypothetical protein
LIIVPTPNSFGLNNTHYHEKDIEEIAKVWERNGFGALRHVDHGIMIRPYFRFDKAGFKAADRLREKLQKRPFRQRLARIWSAISAIAAIVAAAAAVFAAYFSYLSLAQR